MRCPECNKFPALDSSAEPETDFYLDGATITGSVRIVLTSECCSAELKEATFDVDEDLSEDLENAIIAKVKELGLDPKDLPDGIDFDADGVELEITIDSTEITDRFEDKTRTGKTIKNPRYQTHMFGFEANVSVSVKYPFKGQVIEAKTNRTFGYEIASSSMDELV